MTSSPTKLLMLGLRGSGKTTYLASLWHFLESAEIPSDLVVDQLQPNREYLNSIRDSWLAFKEVGRTSSWNQEKAEMSLRNTKTGETIDIAVPDLSGETFQQQWATRKVSASYVESAEQCSGAILFIHPNRVRRTHLITPTESRADVYSRDDKDGDSVIAPSDRWSPNHTATQVQLVDLIQILLFLRKSRKPLRLAVIISAWDLIKGHISPEAWLERKLPLLSQFLRANPNSFMFDVFGVSAQGGDLVEDRQRLLDIGVASSRPQITGGGQRSDLTSPLRFAMADGAE